MAYTTVKLSAVLYIYKFIII